MEKIRLGIIGLGRLGRKHAENLFYKIPNAELIALCSVVQEELDSVSKEMDVKHVTQDYREILNNKELDGVVIASNSQFHCKMICDAAEAGVKNIYTEKPLGMSIAEINRIRDTVNKNHVSIFQIGYNRRFDSSYQAMKQKIDEGFIGKPVLVKMINRDPAAMAEYIIKFSPTSGGLVFDMLTHDYDSARWLVGSDAKSIYGLGGVYAYEGLAKVNDIDNCGILVGFKNGTMGWFETTRNCTYGYHVETEVFGTEGCIRVCTTPTKDRVTYLNVDGVNQKCVQWFYEYWEPSFVAEMQHFVDCIAGNKQPLVGLEDGYKAVQWAFAAKEAVAERKVVEMK
jgi:myo-inositol 2-dehydrogenase/D-chiro-inositol 1-dehydrogenase